MTTVFLGGSRRIARFPVEVERRLDAVVAKRFRVVIGDAAGADKAVQQYLARKAYRHVTVFCMRGRCRHNVAGWPVTEIDSTKGAKGFDYFALKDAAMAQVATHGLMLWDGESRGTLNNVLNLTRQNKPVAVYVAPLRTFKAVRTESDLESLLQGCPPDAAAKLQRQLGIAVRDTTPSLLG